MSGQLNIPCQGKTFGVGMLYNFYSEEILHGRNVWKKEMIEAATPSKEKQSNVEEVSEKVDGSAGVVYKCDNRIQLLPRDKAIQCSITSYHKAISIDDLGSADYPQALKGATHIVTAITYGSDTVIDCNRNKEEVNKIVSAIYRMQGIGETEIRKILGNDFRALDPSVHTEAFKMFEELSETLRTSEIIPKMAYLISISKLANGPERELDYSLPGQIKDIVKSFDTAEKLCHKLEKIDTYNKFVNTKQQISNFLSLLKNFEKMFKDKCSQDEESLRKTIRLVASSPFSSKKMEKFLERKKGELLNLSQNLENIRKKDKGKKIWFDFPDADDGKLETLKTDSDYKHVVCFAFQVTSGKSAYLHDMEKFSMDNSFESGLPSHPEWFDKPGMLHSRVSQFIKFVEANYKSKDLAFVVKEQVGDSFEPEEPSFQPVRPSYQPAESSSQASSARFVAQQTIHDVDVSSEEPSSFVRPSSYVSQPATSYIEPPQPSQPTIIVYTSCIPRKFEPPGKPGCPTVVSYTTDSITLKWNKPDSGTESIESYNIICTSTNSSLSYPTKNKETCMTVTNLTAGSEYAFTVRAKNEIGLSAESEICRGTTEPSSTCLIF